MSALELYADAVYAPTYPVGRIEHCAARVAHLQRINQPNRADMARIRSIMDGGAEGMVALLGPALEDFDPEDRIAIPAANLMLSGTERAAHRLGRRPDLRVDPPFDKDDKESAHKAAEKRERIVEAFDDVCAMEMLLPQLARWLIGYGFAPLIVTEHYDVDGNPYPDVELRDPFECWPSEWGVKQQPIDIAFVRRIPAKRVEELYPHTVGRLEGPGAFRDHTRLAGGAVALGLGSRMDHSRWENPNGDGLAVVEYYDKDGHTTYCPSHKVILDHVPTPAGKPLFHVFKRFAFNRLQGQFQQAIGLMASIAKVNLLVQIAMEDAVFSETNIYGSGVDADDYEKGRDAVNAFDTGTRVEKPSTAIPYQMFQHVSLLERQFRQTTRYSAQDDGESPTSWATGRGLENLSAGTNAELAELRIVLAHGLERVDSMRLEHDELLWPNKDKPLMGVRQGEPFAETYTPARHIKRSYRTRRVYGAMAGWDDATKIVTGLQLRQSKNLSRRTFMENIDGLENISRELQRIDQETYQEMLDAAVAQRAMGGDMAALQLMIESLPAGTVREKYERFFPKPEPVPAGAGPLALGPGEMPAQPDDVSTVLSRLQMSGEAEGGVMTVGRM